MNRLPSNVVDDLLEVTGVSDIGPGDDPWHAIMLISRMTYGLAQHDQALVYAATVRHLEQAGHRLGPILESYFFDRMTQEMSIHGQEPEGQGGEVRKEDRAVAVEGIGPRRTPPNERAAAGERGGREGAGRVEVDLGGASEAPAGTESVESPTGSRVFSDLPF